MTRSDRHAATRGFTLIELAIVVLILGILAAIAIPNYFSARERARRTSCVCNQRGMVPHVSLYVADMGVRDAVLDGGDLFAAGYLPAGLTDCPLSADRAHDDYRVVIVDAEITDVNCEVGGDDHAWP